ncbi:MAG: hypothetical protein CMJ54_07760 [Planctomycetaceae bacterium]|nr:hypothetical protein [Planctomycetaceae bacterium]
MITCFAQTSQGADRLFADILPWLGLLVVIILLGGGLALFLRRRLSTIREDEALGFTLADLRKMRDSGEISEVEFTSAKTRMLGALKPVKPADESNPTRSKRTPGQPRSATPVPPLRRQDEPTAGDAGG